MNLEINGRELSNSLDEFIGSWNDWKKMGAQIEESIDYKKLTEKQLRRLITMDVNEALDEFDRRIEKGEIKRRGYSIEEIEEMITNPGLAKKLDRKSTRLNSSHLKLSRMPSSA